jgi:hypothetical protein
MKKISIILLCLLFSCGSKEKQQENAKKILGKWTLMAYKGHTFVVSADSIYYPARKDYKDRRLIRSAYKLFGDSIKTTLGNLESNVFALSFKGNDSLILNGIDGEYIYTRIK